jgi:hypothetical protein
MGSSASSLCTFLPIPSLFVRTGPSAGFAQGHRAARPRGVGFPEFTRCFNHSLLWKLQREPRDLQPLALPVELPGNEVESL